MSRMTKIRSEKPDDSEEPANLIMPRGGIDTGFFYP